MIEGLTGQIGIVGTVAIESSQTKTHRSAAGGKRGYYEEAIGRSRAAGRRRSTA
jgi:hypothetical protein